jgi:hypothetical protein
MLSITSLLNFERLIMIDDKFFGLISKKTVAICGAAYKVPLDALIDGSLTSSSGI